MDNFAELKVALMKFRELFLKRILPNSVVAMSKDFLHHMRITEEWRTSDALRVYNLIKPYQDKLLKIGYDFKQVPVIKMQVNNSNGTAPKLNKTIQYNQSEYIIFTPYVPNIINAIRNIPVRRYDTQKKLWYVPIDQSENLIHFAHAFGFTMGEKAEKIMYAVKNNLEASYNAEAVDLNIPLKMDLFPFQSSGVDYCMKNERVIIADEMGLGKTVQAIATLKGTGKLPAIVICPKSLRYNWKDEFEKFTDIKAEVLDKKLMKNLDRYLELNILEVIITNYEGVVTYFAKEIKKIHRALQGEIFEGGKVQYRGLGFIGYDKTNEDFREMKVIKINRFNVFCQVGRDPKNIIEVPINEVEKVKIIKVPILNGKQKLFKSVVLDEGHECRNKTTIRFKAIKQVFDEKLIRLILTGTPIVKGPEDLAALLELLGRIEEFGGRTAFLKTYTEQSSYGNNNVNQNKERLKQLNVRLRSLCFIRREKFQVLSELPDKFRQIIRVDIDNRKEYDHAYLSLLSYLASAGSSSSEITRAMRAEMLVKINILKQLSAKGKISEFKEFAEQVMSQGEKLIVFSWFKETAVELLKSFPGSVSITGMDSDEQVQENKKQFMENPDVKMIVVSYKRGGVGHTLTASSEVAFIELGWTYKDQAQAEDRAHRIGQKNNVNCYYFLGRDTIDESIYKIIDSRRQIEKDATGGTTEIETSEFEDLVKALMNNTTSEHVK